MNGLLEGDAPPTFAVEDDMLQAGADVCIEESAVRLVQLTGEAAARKLAHGGHTYSQRDTHHSH